MYFRKNYKVFFIFPALAVGIDENECFFLEVAWFNYAAGLGVL